MDKSKVLVMLDNGHGSNCAGKRSPIFSKEMQQKFGIDRFYEYKYVREIVAGIKAFLISVHVNAAGSGQWKNATGWSTWTSVGQTAGDKLADKLYEAAHVILDPKKLRIRTDKSDGDEDWESNFYVLKNTNCPATLSESFFMDNEEDVKYLLSPEGKNDIIKIHVDGIKRYIASL